MASYAAGGGCLRLDSQQVIEPWKDPLKTSQFRKPPCGFQVYVVVLMQWGGDPIIPSNIFLVSLWLVWSQLSWSCHIVWWPKMLEFNTQISSCCLAVAEDGIKKSNKIESPQSGWSQRQVIDSANLSSWCSFHVRLDLGSKILNRKCYCHFHFSRLDKSSRIPLIT